MTLSQAELGVEYKVTKINTNDEELEKFLFSLGCYTGEPVTVVTKKRNNIVLVIKDARYNIDKDLAEAIVV